MIEKRNLFRQRSVKGKGLHTDAAMPITDKRAAVFAHYDRDGIVDDYVLFYLSSLRKMCDRVVFVSTAALSAAELGKVRSLADVAITRENAGHDFSSYKAGLAELEKTGLETYSEIIMCNDSAYGPLYPLEEMFASMENSDADFWGVTESREISHHIQSYFLVFRRAVFLSEIFSNFWAAMVPVQDRFEVVRRYEVGLARLLEENGFTSAAYIKAGAYNFLGYVRLMLSKFKKLRTLPWEIVWLKVKGLARRPSSVYPNPTFTLWEELLITRRNPFLKISLFRYNPAGVEIDNYPETIKSVTHYDAQLITKHLARVKLH